MNKDGINVYESAEIQSISTPSLYKTSGVLIATFFGSILAGGFVMYLNFKRLGLENEAKKCLLYSTIATIVIFGIIFLIPDDLDIPTAAFTIPQLIAMSQIAKIQQGTLIEEHARADGPFSSNWKAFGIGLFFFVGILAIAFVSFFAIAYGVAFLTVSA